MLGIAVGEDPLVAQDYADRMGGTFPILADPSYLAALIPEDEYPEARELVTSYTINNFPTHIFIDRGGTVRSLILSPMSYEDAVRYGEEIIASVTPEVSVMPARERTAHNILNEAGRGARRSGRWRNGARPSWKPLPSGLIERNHA